MSSIVVKYILSVVNVQIWLDIVVFFLWCGYCVWLFVDDVMGVWGFLVSDV